MNRSVKTPCIGVCSTVFGDDVCRGCKRFQHEVIQWNSYSDSEKGSVLNRLEILKTQIMQSKVLISDETLLKELKSAQGKTSSCDNNKSDLDKKIADLEKKLAEKRAKKQAKSGTVKYENDNSIPLDQVITLDHLTNPDKK